MDAEIQMAYSIWRFNMWSAGFGSYEDIEWAESWLLLKPFKHPGRIQSAIVKWIIKRHQEKRRI